VTQDEELIALAVQADLCDEYGTVNYEYGYLTEIIAYGKLVAAKERERYMQLFLDPENQPTQFGTATQEYREQEIKDEREACAYIAEGYPKYGESIAEEIRARGKA
jgi:hypothetical protein